MVDRKSKVFVTIWGYFPGFLTKPITPVSDFEVVATRCSRKSCPATYKICVALWGKIKKYATYDFAKIENSGAQASELPEKPLHVIVIIFWTQHNKYESGTELNLDAFVYSVPDVFPSNKLRRFSKLSWLLHIQQTLKYPSSTMANFKIYFCTLNHWPLNPPEP